MKKTLTYDDVQIVPKYSELEHRGDINLNTKLTKNGKLWIPIVASPMDSITEYEMAYTMWNFGGIGFIHRFMSIEKQSNMVDSLKKEIEKDWKGTKHLEVSDETRRWFENPPIGAAIGVTRDYVERAKELVFNGCNVILIDVAHGHHKLVKEALGRLKNEVEGEFEIIAGCVATGEGTKDLCEWGADAIRVGIGNGSLCETRLRTGVGIPQVSAIIDCVTIADSYDVPIIADGGVRNVGDVCKGLGCGADTVMLGSLLSGTKETPGEIEKVGQWPNEQLFKKYRGSASLDSKLDRGEDKNVEGNSKVVPYKGKIRRILGDVIDGIRSSCSYVGASNLEEYRSLVEFVEVTKAGQIEAQPHLLN
jgi:IMP dehydrogenase